MKILRWIACVPLAILSSVLTWAIVRMIFRSVSFGSGRHPIENAIGLLPLVLAAILANVAFALAGVLTAPTSGRAVAFVFFGLTFCLSAGGFDIINYGEPQFHAFWLTSSLSYIIGAGLGLIASLRLQRSRRAALQSSENITPRSAAR